MNDGHIEEIISILGGELEKRELPIVSHLAKEKRNPFVILISTLLSLRTKDEVTSEATKRLLSLASTPQEMLQLSSKIIAKTIYPVGFYKNKAKNIIACNKEVVERFGGNVPDTMEDLVTLPGVGRKTANVLLGNVFGKQAIAVDTHVFRVAHRLELAKFNDPDKVEQELCKTIPQEKWTRSCLLIGTHGRRTCIARKPLCNVCVVEKLCNSPEKINITKCTLK